jgi:cellulose synthase/poly-beta-1,6-N-acetylglucosamine synthase-like glycosyltransferase
MTVPGVPMEAIRWALAWGLHAATLYLVVVNTACAVLLLLSIRGLWRHWQLAADQQLQRFLSADALPPVSLLACARDEAPTIAGNVAAFLALEYPHLEVVVVNDGSADDTMRVLLREFDLYEVPPAFPVVIPTVPVRAYYRSRRHSRLLVVDKGPGGAADARNAALNAARHSFVVAVDAQVVIESDALVRLARPVLLGPDVAAVGGVIRVANDSRVELDRVADAHVPARWLAGGQVVESLRTHLFERLGWNALGGSLIAPRVFALFGRDHLRAIGGYRAGTAAPETDLVVRLRRYLAADGIAARVSFVPDAVLWTQVPESRAAFARQRIRESRGLRDVLLEHRGMLFRPRHGGVGLLALPFQLFGELLGPLAELAGWAALALGSAVGAVGAPAALLFVAVAAGYPALLALWAVVLEFASFDRAAHPADRARLVVFALVSGLGYRPFTAVLRLRGLWSRARGGTV